MKLDLARFTKSVALAAVLVLAILNAPQARTQAEGQKTFASSKEAVDTFMGAVRDGDSSDLKAILGPGSEQIISSGDSVADKTARDNFVANYDVKHSLVEAAPHQLTLNVGKDDWPLPIPLVHAHEKWYWDGMPERKRFSIAASDTTNSRLSVYAREWSPPSATMPPADMTATLPEVTPHAS